MFHIDKTLMNPNIPITIRFTSVLREWLRNKADKEEISFNQMVLLCCKYAMDEEEGPRKIVQPKEHEEKI